MDSTQFILDVFETQPEYQKSSDSVHLGYNDL